MNKKIWITIGAMALGLVLALLGGWNFLLKPVDQALVEKETEKIGLEQKLAVAKQRAAQFERFQAESENVRRALDFYGARLDPAMSRQELVTLCYGLVNSLNMLETKIEIGQREKTAIKGLGNLDEVGVKYTFKADMNNVGQFINAATSSRRLISPEKVSLKGFVDPEGRYHETLVATIETVVLLSPGGKK